MVAVHEGFCQDFACPAAGGDHRIHLVQRNGKGLLAQHVHPRLQGVDAPLGVQVVGQADVGRIDLARVQHGSIAAERLRDVPFGGVCPSASFIPAGDSHQLAALVGADRRDQPAVDAGSGKQTPTDLHVHTSRFSL